MKSFIAYQLKKSQEAAHKRAKARRDLRRAAGVISPEEYRLARAATGCGLNADPFNNF